ncbi:peptidase inhibitor family I36 protein [Amycolatopsis sp. NPDC058278]|uniref:peptidase inhibitor family I36 protein n=1 Tax=Amycolatopsis sp. NPDC058278 TaxID=3346417 RepID=UPI0036DECA03
MRNRRALTKSGAALAILLASVTTQVVTASPADAAGTCPFTDTLCMWDQSDFNGASMNVLPLPPNPSACVDLVEHGWGNRVRSAINTSSKAAAMFQSDNCTGHPFPIEGNSQKPSITFAANSVFVQR